MNSSPGETVDQLVRVPTGAETFDGADVPVILPANLRVGRKPAGTSDQGRTEDS